MKRLVAILLPTLIAAIAVAGRTAADFFVSAPTSIMPLLDENTRLDMLDYFRYGSSTASANRFDGQARLTAEDSLSVSYELTKTAVGQMAVLEAGGDTIVMVITTVATPHPDSAVAFYDKSWKPLRKAVIDLPGRDDWLVGDPGDDDPLPFVLAEAVYDPAGRVLTFTNVMDRYFAVAPDYLRRSISYTFDGKKFKKQR